MESFRILLLIFLVLCALFVSFSKNLLVSVIIFMSYSLMMSIIWILLESPDLAITEAAVGAGVTSLLFFVTLKKIKKEISVINWEIAEAEKGGFDHFMLKEIYEQPRAILNTITPRIKNNEINFEKLNLTKSQIKNINRIVITACGSAYHAGIVAKYFYEEILRIPTEVELASEFRYKNPIINKNTLVIIISQSGETADTLAALKQAKEK